MDTPKNEEPAGGITKADFLKKGIQLKKKKRQTGEKETANWGKNQKQSNNIESTIK